jgi:acetate kinase
MLVLAVNSGSSSLKCAVVDPVTGAATISLLVESVGSDNARLIRKDAVGSSVRQLGLADHSVALRAALGEIERETELFGRLGAVGHRVVHGGQTFHSSVLIDPDVEREIERCSDLAPLHNPPNLLGIRACREALPHLCHVAVFDTAFHQTLPEYAYRYAVPEFWLQDHGIRRYGFHGTSHRFVADQAAKRLGRPLSELHLITAHLGNGCSLAAISSGMCVDTTMGFTPLEGLVMGSRSGDLDPAIVFHLLKTGMTAPEIETALNKESGLLGLSGLTHDMRTLTENADQDPRAKLAIEVFCHRLSKYIGALRTSFERLDALIFTGGIGEHSALVRAKVGARLRGLGVEMDETMNLAHETFVDSPRSQVKVLVIPTNEEWMIAQDTLALAVGSVPT